MGGQAVSTSFNNVRSPLNMDLSGSPDGLLLRSQLENTELPITIEN
jgi:hypothetical protein